MMKAYSSTAQKYIAARNALVAKYTFETLDEVQKQSIDRHIVDLLILRGISESRAVRYRHMLRETQYYGMAALAMAFLGIGPALRGILYREQWASVANPLVALTDAQTEILLAANEIRCRHGVQVIVSDEDKRGIKWNELLCPRAEGRGT